MTIPPAFQSGAPFGGDVGGTNPMFWGYDPTARFDSWLTVGITDGHADSKLSSIGVHQLVALGLTLVSFCALHTI